MTMHKVLGTMVILGISAVLMAPADCGPTGTPGMGAMSATIDGTNWNAGNCNINEIATEEIITITGADAAGATMVCSLLGIDGETTLDLADDSAPGGNCSWTDEDDIGGSFGSISGELDISTWNDELLEGTFEFTGEDTEGNTVEVTNGEFTCEWGINPLG